MGRELLIRLSAGDGSCVTHGTRVPAFVRDRGPSVIAIELSHCTGR
jgi:hypothetical protein